MRETHGLPEVLVHDGLERCPYLPGRLARLPLRYPLRKLTRRELDQRLAAGDRRQGPLLYQTACPGCKACVPIRIDVDAFRPNRSQRRAWRAADDVFDVEIGPPQVDDRRIALYNLHKHGRDLAADDGSIDVYGYTSFLVDSCCDTIEYRYWVGDELVGVAVADVGETAMSAVYCYFDPQYSAFSPGVYSVLRHIEQCRRWNLKHLYLGFYIEEPSRMNYKASYRPYELLIDGQWRRGGEGE